MTTRRCLSTKIVSTDSYAQLSYAEQSMYIQLFMSADDDGFVMGPGLIAARYRNGKTILHGLVSKGYLLLIDGVYIIAHWRVANTLKTDRLKPLDNPDVAAKIWIKQNRMYTDVPDSKCITLCQDRSMVRAESKCVPDGSITKPNLTQENINQYNTTQTFDASIIDVETCYQEIVNRYPPAHLGDLSVARRAYDDSIVTQEDARQALINLEAWIVSNQWTKEGGRFIPDLSSWISKQRWRYTPTVLDTADRRGEEQNIENIKRFMA